MPMYSVTAVERDGGFTNEHGEFFSWKLMVKDGETSTECSINTRSDKPAPTVGQQIDGTLEPGKFRPKLKKNFSAGGGNSGGGSKASNDYRSPEQIMRSYAQSQALQYWKLKHEGDPAYVISTWGEFQAVVELFYQDVKGAS
jgi:hypothetical protein